VTDLLGVRFLVVVLRSLNIHHSGAPQTVLNIVIGPHPHPHPHPVDQVEPFLLRKPPLCPAPEGATVTVEAEALHQV